MASVGIEETIYQAKIALGKLRESSALNQGYMDIETLRDVNFDDNRYSYYSDQITGHIKGVQSHLKAIQIHREEIVSLKAEIHKELSR